jgi:hypothetical protein
VPILDAIDGILYAVRFAVAGRRFGIQNSESGCLRVKAAWKTSAEWALPQLKRAGDGPGAAADD